MTINQSTGRVGLGFDCISGAAVWCTEGACENKAGGGNFTCWHYHAQLFIQPICYMILDLTGSKCCLPPQLFEDVHGQGQNQVVQQDEAELAFGCASGGEF